MGNDVGVAVDEPGVGDEALGKGWDDGAAGCGGNVYLEHAIGDDACAEGVQVVEAAEGSDDVGGIGEQG